MKKKALLLVLGGLVLLMIVAALTVNQTPNTGGGGGSQDERDDHGAWAYMQIYVENKLAPNPTDFPWVNKAKVDYLGAGEYEVSSYVDTKNALGGAIRRHFSGTIVKFTEDDWRIKSFQFK